MTIPPERELIRDVLVVAYAVVFPNDETTLEQRMAPIREAIKSLTKWYNLTEEQQESLEKYYDGVLRH